MTDNYLIFRSLKDCGNIHLKIGDRLDKLEKKVETIKKLEHEYYDEKAFFYTHEKEIIQLKKDISELEKKVKLVMNKEATYQVNLNRMDKELSELKEELILGLDTRLSQVEEGFNAKLLDIEELKDVLREFLELQKDTHLQVLKSGATMYDYPNELDKLKKKLEGETASSASHTVRGILPEDQEEAKPHIYEMKTPSKTVRFDLDKLDGYIKDETPFCKMCELYGECDHQGAYQRDGKWCYEQTDSTPSEPDFEQCRECINWNTKSGWFCLALHKDHPKIGLNCIDFKPRARAKEVEKAHKNDWKTPSEPIDIVEKCLNEDIVREVSSEEIEQRKAGIIDYKDGSCMQRVYCNECMLYFDEDDCPRTKK